MPKFRPTAKKTLKAKGPSHTTRQGRAMSAAPKLAVKGAKAIGAIGEIVRQRAQAEAAIADARKSHERLREAIDILPQGIVFLDAEGRYILWNKKYAEIYNRSSDQFAPGARLQDTIRVGVERGDYPEAIGREDEWIAERVAKLFHPGARHEQTLADGRVILIEERLTEDGGVVGLRVDITELKQREASFRLLFESNPVPMIVCALEDERVLSVNDAAIEHYGYTRPEFEKLTIRQLQAFDAEPPWVGDHADDEQAARTWKHVKADGALIDLAIYSRHLVYNEEPAVMLALMDITERKRAEMRLAFMAHHDGLTGLPNRNLLRQRLDEILRIRGAMAKKSPCCFSVSIISRASTTPSDTVSATSCCAGWRGGCVRHCARKMHWRVSTPMNSPLFKPASAGRKTSCCWRAGCSMRSARPICSMEMRW